MSGCVITGCGLVTEPGHHFWGDLWEEEDCWIFNACGSEEGLEEPLNPNEKCLTVFTSDYFQRRNVFVIAKALSSLNQPARDYLEKAPS